MSLKLLLASCVVLGTSLHAADTASTVVTTKTSNQRTFVLPVNWADSPKLGMVVTVPSAFKPIGPAVADDSNSPIMEYILETENESNWTQRITIAKYIGKNASAQTVVNQIKTLLLAKVSNPKIWVETNSTKPNFQQSMLGIRYEFQEKREFMGAQFNSGPYDCVRVQYTLRPQPSVPEEDLTRIIDDFFRTNVQVVSFTPV